MYLIVLLISSTLITNDFEHPFICLFAIYESSLAWSLFSSFAHVLIRLFLLLLSSKSSLYILGKSLYQICDLQVFSQVTLTYLFIVLKVSFTEQKFLPLIKYNLSTVSFIDCPFGLISHCQTQAT